MYSSKKPTSLLWLRANRVIHASTARGIATIATATIIRRTVNRTRGSLMAGPSMGLTVKSVLYSTLSLGGQVNKLSNSVAKFESLASQSTSRVHLGGRDA
jgi:hypothetical protein